MDATYVSSSQFTVEGDHTGEFISGRRLKMNCGTDGIFYATVSSSELSGSDTNVVINESNITSNLESVLYGVIQPGDEGSLPEHSHDGSSGSGGEIDVAGIAKKMAIIFG